MKRAPPSCTFFVAFQEQQSSYRNMLDAIGTSASLFDANGMVSSTQIQRLTTAQHEFTYTTREPDLLWLGVILICSRQDTL